MLSVTETFDKGFALTGYGTNFPSQGGGAFIAKTDSAGNLIWAKYPWSGKAHVIKQTSDSGFVVIGDENSSSNMFVLKTSSNGTTQWAKVFDAYALEDANDVIETADNGFIIAGYSLDGTDSTNAKSYGVLFKLDSLGNLQWQKAYGNGNNCRIFSIDKTDDNGIVATGITANSSINSGMSTFFLFKFDINGNFQWGKSYYNPASVGQVGYSVIKYHDGGYVLTGEYSLIAETDIFVIKSDSSGTIEWSKTFGAPNTGEYSRDIKETNSGNILILGNASNSSSFGRDAYLFKIDSIGNMQWGHAYGGSLNDEGLSLTVTEDSGAVIVGGWEQNQPLGAAIKPWLLKTDINGISCNNHIYAASSNSINFTSAALTLSDTIIGTILNASTLSDSSTYYATICSGITNEVGDNISQSSVFIIYPNPNQGTFTVKASSLESDEWNLNIYDAIGRLVTTEKITGNSIDVSVPLPIQGLYLVCLEGEGNRLTQKVIVE